MHQPARKYRAPGILCRLIVMSRYLTQSRNEISGNVLNKMVYKIMGKSGHFTLINPSTLANLLSVRQNNLNNYLRTLNANNVRKLPSGPYELLKPVRNPFYGGNLKRGNIRKVHLYGGGVTRAVEKFKNLLNKKKAKNALNRATENARKRANALRNQQRRLMLTRPTTPLNASQRVRRALRGVSPPRRGLLFG